MAQNILKNIVDDVKATLSGSTPNAEFPISDIRIEYWVRQSRDQLVAEYMSGKAQHDASVFSAYKRNLGTSALVPKSEAVVGATRYYIELDRAKYRLLDLPFDRQIVDAYWHRSAVPVHARARIVSQQELANIKAMTFTAPTETNPVIYALTTYDLNADDTLRIYIEGPGANTTTGFLELWGILAATPHDATMLQTDQIDNFTIAPQHIQIVTELAIQKGARELGLTHLINPVNEGLPITVVDSRTSSIASN